MRGGLANVFYAKMVGNNEDFLKLGGDNENNFQRFIMFNLIGDIGDTTNKVLIPYESETLGV